MSESTRWTRRGFLGLLVDMEVTLSNLANFNAGRSAFAKGHAKRLKATFKDFEKAVKALVNQKVAQAKELVRLGPIRLTD